MAIKHILVPLYGNQFDVSVLRTALQATAALEAKLVGLFVRPDPREALPYLGEGASGQLIDDIMTSSRQGADLAYVEARKVLAHEASQMSLPMVDDMTIHPSCTMTEEMGRADYVVEQASRLTDLVVFGQRSSTDDAIGGEELASALLMARRPVLLAPLEASATFGTNITIGWDGSQEASHAVTAAMPFLRQARHITVLSIEKENGEEHTQAGLINYLSAHGCIGEHRHITASGRPIGEALLDESAALKSDLLVVGGYSHSRLRELIVGGVTRHIRGHTSIPVLMAH
ncbi:MAG: universal stress protein [Parvibaculaceae bacterium]|nr:universal stress protein [Parvibaculaceae bacterium]